MRQRILSAFLGAISRAILRDDQRTGRMARMLEAFSFTKERIRIASGARELSAVYVQVDKDTPAVLICHGIGELVEYWGGVQGLLKTMGVSSLVFNYSGYGESTGGVTTANCEEDALAAYTELVERGHRSIVLLGFSLGTGVGCAVATRMNVDGVVLCQGFTSLREAGIAMGFPRWMTRAAPDVWNTAHRVCELEVPVLVVHSDVDGLFPLSMAERVAEACGDRGRLIVIPGVTHNLPIFAPTEEYWRPIAEWVKARASTEIAVRLRKAGD
jgi:pimeloyl-ACP methyl ester carboxylesterase